MRDERRLQRLASAPAASLAALRLALSRCRRARAPTSRFGGLLHVEIDRRVDLQPALVDALPSEPLHELLAHFFLEVLRRTASSRAQPVVEQRGWLRSALLVGRAIDRAGVAHRLQDDVAPRDRARRG